MAKISAKLHGVELVNDEATIRLGVSSAPGFTHGGKIVRHEIHANGAAGRLSVVDLGQASEHANAGDVVVISIRIERKA